MLFRNGIYNIASIAVRTIVAVVTIPLLVRSLGLDQYGMWILISSFIGLIGFVEGGLSSSSAYFVSRDLSTQNDESLSSWISALTVITILLCIAVMAVVWVSADIVPLFNDLNNYDRIVSHALQIGAVAIGARVIQSSLIGIKQALQRYLLIGFLLAIQAIITNGGLIIVAWNGGRISDLMKWLALSSAGMTVVHFLWVLWLLRGHRVRFIWDKDRIRGVGWYSLTTWMAILGGTIFSQGDRLIVGALLGSYVAGLYGVITGIASQINIFTGFLTQPLLPLLSKNLMHLYSNSAIKKSSPLTPSLCGFNYLLRNSSRRFRT